MSRQVSANGFECMKVPVPLILSFTKEYHVLN